MPEVPQIVLRTKFPAVSGILQKLARSTLLEQDGDGAGDGESNDETLTNLVVCIGVSLNSLQAVKSQWNRPAAMKLFNVLLHCLSLSDEAPQAQSSSQKWLVRILKAHSQHRYGNCVRTGAWCLVPGELVWCTGALVLLGAGAWQ